MEPIVLHGEFMSPNPAKIRIILEELGLPFRNELVTFSTCKDEAYTKINPNGRMPAIHDPNTGITLWESGAITTYLIEQYDKEQTISYQSFPEKFHIQQWIAFQISGQGPYYGQGVFFSIFFPDKVPLAIERYDKEIERVRSVIDAHLRKVAEVNSTSEPWLVGDKCTAADLSFVMWENVVEFLFKMKNHDIQGKYPAFDAWIARLFARPACQKAIETRAKELEKVARAGTGLREDMRADVRHTAEK